MPQAPRKDNQVQRAQDKESKRARGALSCAECRRLKLKCDKTVPCSSCKRRGCSAICPNGSLITGQGTRFVLADTETLHQKIALMSDRIRQLEDALAILQSTISGPSGEPHPLLHRDLLKVKSSIELHSASNLPGDEHLDREEEDEGDREEYIDAFGTLAIRDDGAATFYGRSAGSESLLIGESSSQSLSSTISSTAVDPSPPHRYASTSYGDLQTRSPPGDPGYQHFASRDGSLPSSITTLAASFPLAPSLSFGSNSGSSSLSSPSTFSSNASVYHAQPPPITVQTLIANFLPSYAEAVRLVQLYLEQAPWFFGAVTGKQIEEEILPLWYEEAAAAAPSASTPPAGGLQTAPTATANGKSQQRVGTSHDLALLFIVFCFGALTDINLPSPPDNAPAEKFYQLTKVALTLDPASMIVPDLKAPRNGVLERPPSVATVQTLSLMAIYEGICSGENSIETTWALMGLACKLSQSIGLHRDCARWKLTPAEVQKRRALFWELFITDCWQSLATGRLATFSLPFVDCELPADPDKTIAEDGSIQPSFPSWKARFGAECVSAVVQGTLTSRAPKYSIILDLDRKVRDMELPQYAQGPTPQGLGLAQTMSHFMPQNYRELTLLYIHRCFFAHAISSNPLDPIKSQYAPSFLAGYRSACTIVASVKKQFEMFPAQIARFWVLWTHAFSASVMLASVATHSSRSKIAPAALLELKNACDLFEAASPYGGRAGKFLPILKRLQTKAQKAYRDANNGVINIPNDIFKPSRPDEAKDELSIFSGKTHTVSTKVGPSGATLHSSTSASNSIPTSRTSSKDSRSSSDSPQQMFADNPSFAGVHPSLVSELNVFHGQIKAQIQNAYRTGGEVFGAGPMVVDAVPRAPVRSKASTQQLQAQQQVQRQHAQQQAQLLQQQHQQALYQQAKHKQEQLERQETERLEREREEAERREAERLEYERQELARKQHMQQLELQRQQQELQRQQQAQEQQQRQLEAQQQERYRQQLEAQQQQEQMAQRHQPMYETGPQQMYTAPPGPALPPIHVPQAPPPSSHEHQRHPSNPQTQHGMQQQSIYQPPQQHYQFMPRHEAPPVASVSHTNPPPPAAAPHQQRAYVSQPSITPQHTGGMMEEPQHHSHAPQYPTYATTSSPSKNTSPEYSYHPSPESMHSGTSSANYTPPTTSYGASQSQQPASALPTPATASTSYVPEGYRYWPAASTSFAMPDQQPTGPPVAYAPPHGYQQHQPQYQQHGHHEPQPQPQQHEHRYQHQHYTPEGALRGIAADDSSLQETWQSYMNNVGSPRQFLED